MSVASRAAFGSRLGKSAAAAAATTGVAVTAGFYSFIGMAFGVNITGRFFQTVLVLAFLALIVFCLVMGWDGARTLVLRLRPSDAQERELYEAFQGGRARIEIRPGDYDMGRERIEALAGQCGYRLTGERTSYRLVLVFRSDRMPVSAEEAEIADAFRAGKGLVEINAGEYRVSWSRIKQLASEHGYEQAKNLGGDDSPNIRRFTTKGQKEKAKQPWYQDKGCLAFLIVFWPLTVTGALLWVFFRAFEFYLLGIVALWGADKLFSASGEIVVPAFFLGYVPLVTLYSLVQIYLDHRSKKRPKAEQVAEIERKFTEKADTGSVWVSWVRYSLSTSTIKQIGERHGYRSIPAGRYSRSLAFKPERSGDRVPVG